MDSATSNNNCTPETETKAFLSQKLRHCIDILLKFERDDKHGHHRVDNREPLNFYLGYSGVLSSLLLAVKGLACSSSLSISAFLSHIFNRENQFATSLSKFINNIVGMMLDYCQRTVASIQAEGNNNNGKKQYFDRNAHTLMFSQFGASLSVLHQLRFHYVEELAEHQHQTSSSSPFEFYCLVPENKSQLQNLLPQETSFAQILLFIYGPSLRSHKTSNNENNDNNNDRVDSSSFADANECETFYGRIGLVALFLSSINWRNNNNHVDLKKQILETFCLPSVQAILQTGVNQSQAYRQSIVSKLNFSTPPSASGNADVIESFFQRNPIPQILFFWQGQAYLGAAHGTAGILFYSSETVNLLFSLQQKSITKDTNSQQQWRQCKGIQEFILSSSDENLKICKCADSNNIPPSFFVSTAIRHSSENNTKSKNKLSFCHDDRLIQFCHGSGGVVFPLASICRSLLLVLQDESNNNNNNNSANTSASLGQFDYWFKKLVQAGEEVWNRGCLKDSVGLCHSVSGNYFSLLAIYKVVCLKIKSQTMKKTNETKTDEVESQQLKWDNERKLWFDRVLHFAKESATIASTIYREGDHIFSLYEGLGGTLACVGTALILLSHNENGNNFGFDEKEENFLKMPGFEV